MLYFKRFVFSTGEYIVSTFLNAMRAYGDHGLLKAVLVLCGVNGGSNLEEKTIKLGPQDSGVFQMIEKRLAHAKLIRSISCFGRELDSFMEYLVGFMAAMTASHQYLTSDSNKKGKYYSVYLTCYGDVATSPTYILTVKRNTDDSVVISSTIKSIV